MGLIEKLKSVKKKWIYTGLVIVVLAGAGGAAGVIMEHRYESANHSQQQLVMQANKAYYDLLYLQNTNYKLTADQAKSLLPLAENLATADSTTQPDLLKNIYTQLTPQQYFVLMNESNKSVDGKMNRGDGKGERNRPRFEGRFAGGEQKANVNPMQGSLKDVVITMLKNSSTKSN